MPLGPRITNTVPRMSQQAAPFVSRFSRSLWSSGTKRLREAFSAAPKWQRLYLLLTGVTTPSNWSFSRDTTVFSQVNLLKICTEKPTAIHALPWSWRLGSSAFWIVGARVQRSVKNHSGVQRSRSVSSYEEIDRINNFGMISLTKHHLWWGQI